MICGEYGSLFKTMPDLAHHINRRGFKLRRSINRNYHKDTFNPNSPFQLKTKPKNTVSVPVKSHSVVCDAPARVFIKKY